jgi:hypothetical protein
VKPETLVPAPADPGRRIMVLPAAFVPAYQPRRFSAAFSAASLLRVGRAHPPGAHRRPTAASDGSISPLKDASWWWAAESPGPDFEPKEALMRAPKVLGGGGSAILAPDPRYRAGPLLGAEGILTAELDLGRGRRGATTPGRGRPSPPPDVFTLPSPLF